MRVAVDGRKIADYGIGSYIRGLLTGIATLDPPVDVVVLAPRALWKLIPAGGRMSAQDVDAPLYSIRELFSVGRAAGKSGADLLHEPHYVVPFTKLPVVTTIHDLIHLHQPVRSRMARAYAEWMLRRAVRRSDRVLTVTAAVSREIEQQWPEARGKIVVTRNAVDERFSPGSPTGGGGRYVLFVGNDKPHKNLDRLVQAFSHVRKSIPDLSLKLAGGALREGEGIESCGFVSEEQLLALYRGALVVVMPSLEEGFGLPALEAMRCGVPVIISSTEALREVTGGAALEFDPYSVDALRAAIARVVSDGDMRGVMSARGREVALRYDWKTTARETVAVWKAVVEERSRSRKDVR